MTGMQAARLKAESQGRKAKVGRLFSSSYMLYVWLVNYAYTLVRQLANSYHELLEYVPANQLSAECCSNSLPIAESSRRKTSDQLGIIASDV